MGRITVRSATRIALNAKVGQFASNARRIAFWRKGSVFFVGGIAWSVSQRLSATSARSFIISMRVNARNVKVRPLNFINN